MMRRSLLLLCSLSLFAGCNYDPETRVFRAAAPRPEDVVLAAPGAETRAAEGGGNSVEQGLDSCTDDTLRCHAQNIATGLNTLTFFLLTIVDGVVAHPPSHRETGRRVWGPHFDRDNGNTFRFEMSRDGDDTFSWCMHVGAGDLRLAGGMRELTCATETGENGMLRLLSGNLSPGDIDGEGARSGRGTMLLEALRLLELADEPDIVGTFDFEYDNTSGSDVIIALSDIPQERGNRFGDEALYHYTRDVAGNGTFSFDVLADFVGSGSFGFASEREELAITARWLPDNAGRADAFISGGDLADGESYTATHCWDAGLATVYQANTFEPENATGALEACAFSEALAREEG